MPASVLLSLIHLFLEVMSKISTTAAKSLTDTQVKIAFAQVTATTLMCTHISKTNVLCFP